MTRLAPTRGRAAAALFLLVLATAADLVSGRYYGRHRRHSSGGRELH